MVRLEINDCSGREPEEQHRKLLSIEEVREILNVSRCKVYELLNFKRLPVVKIGQRTLIDSKDLWEFIEKQKI